MRLRRPQLLSPLALLLACSGAQQGYYGPCDEPVGLAAGCPAETGDSDEFTDVDACMKLASCGVIYMNEDPPEDTGAPDPYVTQFERCLEILREADVPGMPDNQGEDPGQLVLTCIDESTCADLSSTDVDEDNPPDPNPQRVEAIVGWCGRFDP
jgi:hypothetical protein